MIRKVVQRHDLPDRDATRRDLDYWLGRPVSERLAAVEILRRQVHGSSARLQRSARVVEQTRG